MNSSLIQELLFRLQLLPRQEQDCLLQRTLGMQEAAITTAALLGNQTVLMFTIMRRQRQPCSQNQTQTQQELSSTGALEQTLNSTAFMTNTNSTLAR